MRPLEIIDLGRRQPIAEPVNKCVLNALCARSDGDGACWPSQEQIAADTSFSVRAIRRALLWLEAAGYLTRTARRRANGVRRSDLIAIDLAVLRERAGRRPGSPVAGEAATGPTDRSHRPSRPRPPAPQSGFTTFEQTGEPTGRESPLDPPAGGGPALDRQSGSGEGGAAAPPAPRRGPAGGLPDAAEARFARLLGAYPRDGITLADLGRARRHFGALGEAEQLQAIAAAGAYRELLARRPDTPAKALHGWLRQGRHRNAGPIRGAGIPAAVLATPASAGPASADPMAFLSRYSPHWAAADAAHRRAHGRPLPCWEEHRGGPGRWMPVAALPAGCDPDPQDLRLAPGAMAAGAIPSARRL